MTKVKSNASWNQLTPEQREKLDEWFFKENLGYETILQKAESELGYQGSESSLRRYRERREQERKLTDIKEVVADAAEMQALAGDPRAAQKAAGLVMGTYVFKAVRAAPEDVKTWGPVASLMFQNDHNEAWREIKGEEQKVRREALEFAKDKFQREIVEQAMEALPDLLKLQELRREPDAGPPERNAQVERVRRRMFGEDVSKREDGGLRIEDGTEKKDTGCGIQDVGKENDECLSANAEGMIK